jgi:hypothetical protein
VICLFLGKGQVNDASLEDCALGLAAAFAANSPRPRRFHRRLRPQRSVPGVQLRPSQPAPSRTPPPRGPIGNLTLPERLAHRGDRSAGAQLHINYILDPAVKGSVIHEHLRRHRGLDARNLLELILRINGAGMVQEGDVYRIVPLKEVMARLPIRPEVANAQNIPEDDQIMLNLVFLKYVTVDALTKVLAGIHRRERHDVFLRAGQSVVDSRQPPQYAPHHGADLAVRQRHLRQPARAPVRGEEHARPPRHREGSREYSQIHFARSDKTSPVRFLPVDRINTTDRRRAQPRRVRHRRGVAEPSSTCR